MKNRNVMKRTLAGVLAVLTVAGYTMPANVGGLLTLGDQIVARAADTYTVNVQMGHNVDGSIKVGYDGEYGKVENSKSIASTITKYKATAKSGYKFVKWLYVVDNYTYGRTSPEIELEDSTVTSVNAVFEEIVTVDPTYAPVLASGLTYDGTAKNLVQSNGGEGGTIHYLYRQGDSGTWTAGSQATDAGTYQVAWYSDASDTYNAKGSADDPIIISGSVTIQKATPTASDFTVVLPSGDDAVYNGQPKVATITSNKSGMGSVTIKYYKDSNMSTSYNSAVNVATYTVKFDVNASDNYYSASELSGGSFSITAANAGVTVTAKDLTYGGENAALALVTVSNPKNVGVHYKLSTDSEWKTTIPTATNAGTYTVQWYSDKSADGNYAASGSSTNPNTVDVEIKKAPDSVEVEPEIATGAPYSGSAEHLVLNEPTATFGRIEYSWNGTDGWTTTVPTGTDKGTYTFYYRASGDANHAPTEAVLATANIVAPVSNEDITKFNSGTSDVLKLDQNYTGTVIITRDTDGIIDLNGHSISTLHLRNKNGKITVINGTVGTIDDVGGVSGGYTGPIVLGNVKVTGTAYISDRDLYQVGNTTIKTVTLETPSNGRKGVNHGRGSLGQNAAMNPIAKTGLVYTGDSQLLINPNTLNGLFGCVFENDADQRYFTYYYTRGAKQSDTYVKGSTSNGVVNPNCAPLYATDAGTYTVHYMWDCDESYIETVNGTMEITIATATNSWTTRPAAATVTDPTLQRTYPNMNVLRYTGSNQSLVGNASAVAAKFGSVQYRTSTDGGQTWSAWSTTVPTAKDTGTYMVQYHVVCPTNSNGVKNYTDLDGGTFAVTILTSFDLSDTHENDGVAKEDQVRGVITSLAYDADGNGTFSDAETTTFANGIPAMINGYNFVEGVRAKVTSKAKLQFTNAETGAVLNMGEEFDNEAYTYTFTVPTDVNKINVKRVYNYAFESKGLQLFAKDENVAKNYATDRLVATLQADDFEYQEALGDHVKLNVQEDFELAVTSSLYFTKGGSPIGDPTSVGSYAVTAAVATNGNTYEINSEFEITPRNYAIHSGEAATETDAIEIKTNFDGNKTVYNGGIQVPEVTVTDTLGETTTPLRRGTDYEIGYLDAETGDFVVVAPRDDEENLGGTNVGSYKFYVHFIGNYMNTVESEEEYAEVEWSIVAKSITAADVEAPVAAELTYDTTDQYLVSAGSAGQIGTVYYSLVDEETAYTVNVPTAKEAGVYTVYWYVKGDSNHENYTASEGANAIKVTIAPKQITPTITTSDDTFTYDGNDKTFQTVAVYDGETLIDPSEYDISYADNALAGENTAKLTVSDAKQLEEGQEVGADTTGNYTFDAVDEYFSIAQTNASITVEPKEITYDGAAVDKSDFTVTETNGDTNEYTLTYFADNNGQKGEALESAPKDANTYWVVASITATDNYNAVESEAVKFTIAPKDITPEDVISITVAEADETAADGTNPAAPSAITVKDTALDAELTENKDFTVAYSDNLNAGTGTITVTGTGNYTGTATAEYNVLSVLDISAVKGLITSITYQDEITTGDFADTYNYRTGKEITIVSQGVLKIGEQNITPNKTNAGYIYKFEITAGTNLTTVTHVYNYKTSQVTDPDTGEVTIWGVDNNILNTTNDDAIKLATLNIEPIYYLDNADEKIILTDLQAPSVTLEKGDYTYTKRDDNASLANGKPVNAGKYSVKVRVDLTDGDGTEWIYVNKEFSVLQRPSDSDEISAVVSNAVNPFTGDVYTPVVVVTDTKRAEGEQTLVRGKDYELGYMDDETFVKVDRADDTAEFGRSESGNYEVTVSFIGNYSGTEAAAWKINQIGITPLTIAADSDLEFDADPHPVTVTATDGETAIPENIYTVYYGDADSTADDEDLVTDAPINAGTYKAFIKLNDTDNYAFAVGQTTEITFTVTPKDIESEDIVISYPEVSVLDGWTTCEPIVVKFMKADGRELILTENEDYTVSLNSTNKVKDGLQVLINGKGNFTSNTYLSWDVIAKPTVTLTDSGIKDASEKKIWIRVNTKTDREDAVIRTGVLVYKLSADKKASDVNAENMILANKNALGLVEGSKPGTAYSPSVSNGDYGFVIRPFAEMIDGTIVYEDLIETSYAKVLSDLTTVSVELTESGIKDAANKKIWIKVKTTTDHEDAIAKTGVLIYKLSADKSASDVNADNMTFENKDALGLIDGSKPGTLYSPSVSNGDYGFVIRPFSEKIDGTVDYGDLVESSYAKVLSAATTATAELTGCGVKDAANKKIWIKVDTTTNHEDAIAKTGVLIYKLDANKTAADVNEENMTHENKAAFGFVEGSKPGTTYSPSVSNGDYAYVIRPFNQLIDGSYSYGALTVTSFNEVANQ